MRTEFYLVERCTKCLRTLSYKIIDGHLDRKRMSLAHTRDFLTRGTPLYEAEYGKKPPLPGPPKRVEDLWDETREEAFDHLRTQKKLWYA